jgi:hypothetical protein
MSNINGVLSDLQSDIGNFVSTSVVDVESGMSMGGRSADPDFDGQVASAAFADVLKAYRRAFNLLDRNPDSIQDILATTDDLLVVLRVIGSDRSIFHSLTIGADGNLALARKTMERYESRILEAVDAA